MSFRHHIALQAHHADILIAYPLYLMPPKATSELTQLEAQFLAIAARLFTAAMTFSAHPSDDGQQAYLVRKVKDEIISVGNQFKKFMGDPSKHTKKPCMHPIIQIMSEEWKAAEAEQRMPEWGIFTLDHISGRYLQGLQNHRRWWVTGLPPPQGDLNVAMEVMAAPVQPSSPVSAASPTMPDVPATSKAKACALPPAGSSDPYGAPPASNMPPEAPYAFRHMDSTPSAQGRVSDTSLPRVQVDNASPPPPAQHRCLDIQPLVATGDYRCGTCKNPKVNNAQCVSQLNENHLTYKCAFCAEKRRLCAPAASWAQPIIRLMKFRNIDVPPDVEASYGPSAVGTSSISPGENLESCVNSLEAKMDYVILVLNHLVDQLPPAITPYHPLELPLHPWGFWTQHPSPSHVPVPNQNGQCIVGEAAHHPPCMSKAEALAAQVAHHLSINEISCMYIINNLAPHLPRWIKGCIMFCYRMYVIDNLAPRPLQRTKV
ncbi:hypothetical protein EI94DRAFT_1699433 [Lactarius quietus]|nr:hypothetical protein EI94DRAFT_1699433 [Lactarius quietus]